MALIWNFMLESVLGFTPLDHKLPYRQESTPFITATMGFDYLMFSRLVSTWVFFLDCTTVIMVLDTVMQDHSQYPEGGEWDLSSFMPPLVKSHSPHSGYCEW